MNKPTTHSGLRMAVVFAALALVLPTGILLSLRADDLPDEKPRAYLCVLASESLDLDSGFGGPALQDLVSGGAVRLMAEFVTI